MINLPQGHTQQRLTTHRIYFAQLRCYAISLPKLSINRLEGGKQGEGLQFAVQTNKNTLMCLWFT